MKRLFQSFFRLININSSYIAFIFHIYTKNKEAIMEKNNTTEKTKINENLTLINRKTLKFEGLVEVNSSSETLLAMKLKDTTLTITGQNLHITRLDVTLGILEAEGLVDSIKYGKQANIFKRIFK